MYNMQTKEGIFLLFIHLDMFFLAFCLLLYMNVLICFNK